MIIQLLFIAAVGALVAWCGAKGDPRTELRRALQWRPRLSRAHRPGSAARRRVTTSGGRGHRPTTGMDVAPRPVSEREWNELIAGLDDLADLDHDLE